ncbi:hypothetical protein Sfum_0635 [Syntrophobacter fumaroxidans MPOB]|uniref:Uncharacterized protein n=1 Tax=Syntrophobacter fumaroxidans (strain DSM 10017 / MPOB) TaxID=335543 RepID=A0LFY2_SYNFM|nr:hypothetical protein Sfum_0635 [Syntrophobacter fumaroxidans MPOB]
MDEAGKDKTLSRTRNPTREGLSALPPDAAVLNAPWNNIRFRARIQGKPGASRLAARDRSGRAQARGLPDPDRRACPIFRRPGKNPAGKDFSPPDFASPPVARVHGIRKPDVSYRRSGLSPITQPIPLCTGSAFGYT